MMTLALLLVFVLFGRLAVSVVTLALGVVTELAGCALWIAAFVLRRLMCVMWSALRRLARVPGPATALTHASLAHASVAAAPLPAVRAVRRPRRWEGPRTRADTDLANLIRGMEAARGLPRDPYWDRR